MAFVGSAGRLIGFGIEGTGSYGAGLARYLRNQGQDVHEIARPARAAERRLAGKNDTIDAEHAARQLLSGHGLSTPKTADGAVETIRVKIAYDGAVQARTTAMITLKATLATGSEALRAELEKLTDHKLVTACAALEGPTPLPPVRAEHQRSSCRPTPTWQCSTFCPRWPSAGWHCTRRPRLTPHRSRRLPRPPRPSSSRPSASATTPRRRC